MNRENFKFELGDKVRDRVTGFEGIIKDKTQWLTNCNTYGVMPTALKDDKPQSTSQFDEPDLELVESQFIKFTDNKGYTYDTGDKVEDIITKFSGIIIGRCKWLSGEINYGVRPQKLKDGAPMSAIWISETRLKLLKKNIFEPKRFTGGTVRSVRQDR